ncbi:MAG: MFS transporter [Proteobacteria bacterium]|nr:MFS transporter [Pseudomonadota bacterium]MBU4297053.1 MFS transporter [Pseudomonadota bacterium]MCG2749934.1 MFS transporter [Desulfobulbaceae bacterium]
MKINRETLGWAFYDWANSAFATSIMAGFFPIFFKQYWCSGVEVSTSTFRLGLANSIGSLVVIFLAPILGAMADQAGAKKKFLFFFAMIGIVMSAGLYTVAQGAWLMASLFYIFGIIGFSGGNVFYDSLLVNVSSPATSDRVSALGFSLGYLGGGLLFAVNVMMTLKPGLFGLADAPQAVRLSFLTVGIWWAVFSLPIMLWVKEPAPPATSIRQGMITAGFRQLFTTFKEIRKLRVVLIFLAGYWLYIDGIDTIIRMAVDYGLALGFDSSSLIVALLITQFVGFPAALVFGRLGEKLGTKKAILLGIAIYLLVTVWAMSMQTVKEFYLLAVAIGLVQGGVQSLSRSLYSRLIPAGKSGEFFGFYNILGKFAAVIGPLLMGLVSMFTGSPRLSLLAIIGLFVSGAILLCFVNEEEGARLARQMN